MNHILKTREKENYNLDFVQLIERQKVITRNIAKDLLNTKNN